MTNITVTHTWQQLTTPCVIQVQGGRVGIYVGGTPVENSPSFILQTYDFWEMATSDACWVRAPEVHDTSLIVYKAV